MGLLMTLSQGLTVSENEELFSLASGNLRKQWKQVVRYTLGIFTHDSAGVSTSGVEITQQSAVPFLSLLRLSSLGGIVSLRVDEIGDSILDSELGVTVGVCGAQWTLLGDRDHVREARSITVDGS